MTKAELVEQTKQFCTKNSLKFLDAIQIGRDVLLIIHGDKSAKLLDEFLANLNLKHSTSTVIADGVGSYVTL